MIKTPKTSSPSATRQWGLLNGPQTQNVLLDNFTITFVSDVKIPILRVSKYILMMQDRFTDDYMAYRYNS